MSRSGLPSLGSVISITKGKKHKLSNSPLESSKRLLGIDDLRNDELIRYTDDISGTDVTRGDVLIAWDGANAGTIGFGKEGYIGSTIARLRIKRGARLFSPFLGLYLRSKFDYLRQTATGATIPHISRNALENLPLPQIEFEDQIRIAHLLTKVERLIAQRKQHLQQLGDLLKSVFLEMFGVYLAQDGESTLGDCLTIQQGFAFKSEEFVDFGVPIIKIGTVNKGFFDYSTLSFVRDDYPPKLQRYEINPGDLLISLTGTVGKDDYGNTCFVPRDSLYSLYLLNQRVGKLICDSNTVNPYFVDSFLSLPRVKSTLIKHNRGVRQANLSNADIYSLPLTVPPIDVQEQFAAIVEKVESIKSRYQQSLKDLEHLYGALSQKAFKGELDLSRVPLQPTTGDLELKGYAPSVIVTPVREQRKAIVLPDVENMAEAFATIDGRQRIFSHWLEAYLTQLRGSAFSVNDFLQAAQTRLAELHPDNDFDLGIDQYEQLKDWVFEGLASGRLEQTYDDPGNRVQVIAARG